MWNKWLRSALIFVILFYSSNCGVDEAEEGKTVKFILANSSLNDDGSCNLTWKASKDSTLVYIYANNNKNIFSGSDLTLQTSASLIRLEAEAVEAAKYLHLVIPQQDTLRIGIR